MGAQAIGKHAPPVTGMFTEGWRDDNPKGGTILKGELCTCQLSNMAEKCASMEVRRYSETDTV